MIIIDYHSEDGYCLPDGKAEKWVTKIIKGELSSFIGDTYIQVCSSLLIDCFRVAIHEGRLDPKEIQFTFNGDVLFHDDRGRILDWPKGFGDVGDHILERLLTANITLNEEGNE
jgi:hypothetical protein